MFEIELFLQLAVWKQKIVLMLNWIEIELFICIKMDLELNNLQWLMCHKTQPNQTESKVITRFHVFDYRNPVNLWDYEILIDNYWNNSKIYRMQHTFKEKKLPVLKVKKRKSKGKKKRKKQQDLIFVRIMDWLIQNSLLWYWHVY